MRFQYPDHSVPRDPPAHIRCRLFESSCASNRGPVVLLLPMQNHFFEEGTRHRHCTPVFPLLGSAGSHNRFFKRDLAVRGSSELSQRADQRQRQLVAPSAAHICGSTGEIVCTRRYVYQWPFSVKPDILSSALARTIPEQPCTPEEGTGTVCAVLPDEFEDPLLNDKTNAGHLPSGK